MALVLHLSHTQQQFLGDSGQQQRVLLFESEQQKMDRVLNHYAILLQQLV